MNRLNKDKMMKAKVILKRISPRKWITYSLVGDVITKKRNFTNMVKALSFATELMDYYQVENLTEYN